MQIPQAPPGVPSIVVWLVDRFGLPGAVIGVFVWLLVMYHNHVKDENAEYRKLHGMAINQIVEQHQEATNAVVKRLDEQVKVFRKLELERAEKRGRRFAGRRRRK